MGTIDPIVRDLESSPWDLGCEDEAIWWPRIIWIDPGDVSGVAIVWFDPAALFAGKSTPRCVLAWQEFYVSGPENVQTQRILETVAELGGPSGLAVGVESFVVGRLDMSTSFLAPVRLRSKIEFGLYVGVEEQDGITRRRSAQVQSANDAKRTITDQRLKLWGMYTPGPDHIRDATRHCLLWIRRVRDGGPVFFRKAHGWEEEWLANR